MAKTPMLEIDKAYFGYIRGVWLLMDGLEAVFGWRSMLIVRIYDALTDWGMRRWTRWPVLPNGKGEEDGGNSG